MKLSNNLKHIKVFSSLAVFVALFCVFGSAHSAGNADNGAQLSQTCLGCHGAPGLRNPGPVYSIPMLGGQNEEYLVIALKAYKDKTRSHGTMQAQAASLSDQDIADIAAYFAKSDGESRPSLVNTKLAAIGKEKAASCAACHGADGASTTAGTFPILAGQYESYLLHALKDYRSGERQNAIQDVDGVNSPETDIFKFN